MLMVIRLGGPHITVCIFKLLRVAPEPPRPPGCVALSVPSMVTDFAASRSEISRCHGRIGASAAVTDRSGAARQPAITTNLIRGQRHGVALQFRRRHYLNSCSQDFFALCPC